MKQAPSLEKANRLIADDIRTLTEWLQGAPGRSITITSEDDGEGGVSILWEWEAEDGESHSNTSPDFLEALEPIIDTLNAAGQLEEEGE